MNLKREKEGFSYKQKNLQKSKLEKIAKLKTSEKFANTETAENHNSQKSKLKDKIRESKQS